MQTAVGVRGDLVASVSYNSTAHVKGKHYMHASRGKYTGYTQINYMFLVCKYCEVRRLHAQCAYGILTPVWPTEVFVL